MMIKVAIVINYTYCILENSEIDMMNMSLEEKQMQ